MAKQIFPATKKILGPWFLDKKSLNELNDVVEKIQAILREAYDIYVEENKDIVFLEEGEDNAFLSDNILKLKRKKINKTIENKVIISIGKDERKFEDKTLKGILKSEHIKDYKPKALEISLVYGIYFFKIKFAEDGTFASNIEIEEQKIREDVKDILEDWILANKPNKILQIWSNSFFFSPFILIILTIISFLIASGSLTTSREDLYKNILLKESKSIIEKGINEKNISIAVDLILKLQSNYTPDSFSEKTEITNKSLRFFIIWSLILIFLLIRPKTIIGISKYENKLKFYKLWFKTTKSLIGLITTMILSFAIGFFLK